MKEIGTPQDSPTDQKHPKVSTVSNELQDDETAKLIKKQGKHRENRWCML